MTFRVRTTKEAERDAENILDWLASEHAGDASLRWFTRLEEAIITLSDFPERCAVAPENAEFAFEVRHLIFGQKPHIYRILFTIEDDAVVVFHIRHGRRQPVCEQ